jgi:photosystem II stability/assembly factor-like uncharacterized protein
MKDFKFFLVLCLIFAPSSATMAQGFWVLQRAVGLAQSPDPQLAFSAVDKNICWACNFTNSQFIRTTDGGTTWKVGTVGTGSHCAGISAVDSSTAWIAVINPSGIYKTTDGGITWTKYANAYQETDSYPFSVHFFDSNNGVCVGSPVRGNWEIYTTSDGGADWTRASSIPQPLAGGETPLFNGVVGCPTVAADNCFWFTTRQGSLYGTTDRGMTWRVTPHFMDNNAFSPYVVAFKDSLDGLACGWVNGAALSHTTDGGVTWMPVPLPSPLSTFTLWQIFYEKGTSGTYFITGIENHKEGYLTTPGTAYTTDGGTTWAKINSLPVGLMGFASDGTGWAGGENDSIYRWLPSTATDVSATALQSYGFKLSQNYPNPFNPTTTIEYSIPQSAFVTLKVYDVLGREVTSLVNREQRGGVYEVQLNGNNLSSGVYLYRITAGKFVDTKRLMILK